MTGILVFSRKKANDHCKLTVIWADKNIRAQARNDNISRFGFCKVYRFNLTATCELSLICRRDFLSRGSCKASNVNSTEGRDTLCCGEGEVVGRWVEDKLRVSLDEFPLLTGHLRTLHQSASAPALSTLMSSANSPAMPSSSAAEQCRLMKKELLDKVDILSRALPPNTLDKLIDDLGGPENVAEVKRK